MIHVKRWKHMVWSIAGVMVLNLFSMAMAYAGLASPAVVTLTQPDGTEFKARLWGDERQHGLETVTGHTIVRDKATGNWTYAALGTDGRLQPSALVVGSTKYQMTAQIRKNLRPTRAALKARAARSVRRGPVRKVAGTAQMTYLLGNFSDTTPTYTPPEFYEVLYGRGNKSLKEYFEEVSYGAFSIAGEVGGWYTAPQTHDYYGANDAQGNDVHVGEFARDIVLAADPTFNFAPYDNDCDCYVDMVGIVHQGLGEETTWHQPGGENNIWYQSWTLNEAGLFEPGVAEVVTNDICPSNPSEYIKVNQFTVQAEVAYNHILTVGQVAHEFGHGFLNLPDLYDTTYDGCGVGFWGVMGGGSWNKTVSWGDSPAHFTAWSKYAVGWVNPIQVRGTLFNAEIEAASREPSVYKLLRGGPPSANRGEYFLIENRQQTGFDAGLPGSGLAIWHIDDTIGGWYIDGTNDVNAHQCIPPNDCSTVHYRVTLVQADGLWELETTTTWAPRDDASDLYRDPGNTVFDDSSTPNSWLYDRTPSGVSVTDISISGREMTATLSVDRDGSIEDD